MTMQGAGEEAGDYVQEKGGYNKNGVSWASVAMFSTTTTASSTTPPTPMTMATTPTQRSSVSPGVTPLVMDRAGENVPDPVRMAVRACRMASKIKTLEKLLRQVEMKSCLAAEDVQRRRERAADKEAVIRCASSSVYRGALAAAESELAQATEHATLMARLVHESREDVETIMEDTEKVCAELTAHAAELEVLRSEKGRLDDALATLQVQAQECERREFAALEKASVMEEELESGNRKRQALEETLRALESEVAEAAASAAAAATTMTSEKHDFMNRDRQIEHDAERARDKEQLQRLQEALARERATVRSLIESKRASHHPPRITTTTTTNNATALRTPVSPTRSESCHRVAHAAQLLVHASASGVGVAVAFAAWWFGLMNIETIEAAMLAVTGAGVDNIPWT